MLGKAQLTERRNQHEIEFAVYAHYLTALAEVLLEEHSTLKGMAGAMLSSPAIAKLQRRKLEAEHVHRVKRHLRHAWFTELQSLMPGKFAQVMPYSNHWLPVQVYYSVYLAIRAYFAALGTTVPESHEALLRSIQAEVCSRPDLYPCPWNVVAVGDPSDKVPILLNCPVEGVAFVNPLTAPRNTTAWNLVGQFLRTTRKRKFDTRVEEARSEEAKHRLRQFKESGSRSQTARRRATSRPRIREADRAKLAEKLRPTTLFDAMYRLRVRANYEDADTYLFGGGDELDAATYYGALSKIRNGAMLTFEVLTAHLIGPDAFLRTAEAFLKMDKIGLSDGALDRRVRAIRFAV